MSVGMYDASVPVLLRGLLNLSGLLEKGEAYARENNISTGEMLQAKLAEDMFPFVRQVQIACDMAKWGAARLANVEPPLHPDTEMGFGELQQRIASVIAFVESLDESAFEGSDKRDIVFSNKGGSHDFVGSDYLFYYVVPNLYFHITTAYGLLRQAGVPIGKKDFLGSF